MGKIDYWIMMNILFKWIEVQLNKQKRKNQLWTMSKIGQDMFKNDQNFAIVKLVHDKLIWLCYENLLKMHSCHYYFNKSI